MFRLIPLSLKFPPSFQITPAPFPPCVRRESRPWQAGNWNVRQSFLFSPFSFHSEDEDMAFWAYSYFSPLSITSVNHIFELNARTDLYDSWQRPIIHAHHWTMLINGCIILPPWKMQFRNIRSQTWLKGGTMQNIAYGPNFLYLMPCQLKKLKIKAALPEGSCGIWSSLVLLFWYVTASVRNQEITFVLQAWWQ